MLYTALLTSENFDRRDVRHSNTWAKPDSDYLNLWHHAGNALTAIGGVHADVHRSIDKHVLNLWMNPHRHYSRALEYHQQHPPQALEPPPQPLTRRMSMSDLPSHRNGPPKLQRTPSHTNEPQQLQRTTSVHEPPHPQVSTLDIINHKAVLAGEISGLKQKISMETEKRDILLSQLKKHNGGGFLGFRIGNAPPSIEHQLDVIENRIVALTTDLGNKEQHIRAVEKNNIKIKNTTEHTGHNFHVKAKDITVGDVMLKPTLNIDPHESNGTGSKANTPRSSMFGSMLGFAAKRLSSGSSTSGN